MRFSQVVALGATVASVVASPVRDDVEYNVFEDKEHGTTMRFVKNSGVCETTPGVNQYSGYLDVGNDMHMFFWFFEARNKPDTAPVAAWFNGGPGCSSMIGLFQEHGPCQFYNGSNEPSLNPYSWNEYANMIYIDQPIGAGFSYGKDPVGTTDEAATYVWKLLQAWYKQFPKYKSRDFGIFTESYGGHYGPGFAYYLEQQNNGIKNGSVTGQHIDLIALGVNNGLIDYGIQAKEYATFAYKNKYNKVINKSEYKKYIKAYNNRCKPAISKCTSTSDPSQNNACENAFEKCYYALEGGITSGRNFDVYDIREPRNDPYPPNQYEDYLNRQDIQKKIGAHPTNFQYCSNKAGNKFQPTGDEARPFLNDLSSVVQSGIQVLIWAGDADYICNYMGNFQVVQQIEFAQQNAFRSAKLKSYTVKGDSKGLFKTAGNLSWLQVFEAGHEVPYYQPAIALQAFSQTMSKKALSST